MPKSKKDSETTHAREGSSRQRAPNWTDALDMIMLALMREENDAGHCHNGIFSQETWKMTNLFNERTNMSFSYRNLKNRLKVLKKTFNLYYNLANRSGWGWDPALNLPTCGDEHMWEEVISVNKDYARIKGKSFPVYDDIDILFSRHIATGRRGDTSAIPEGVSDDDTSDDDVDRMNLEGIDFGQPSQKRGGVSYSSSGPFDHRFDDVSPNSPTTCASTEPTDCSLDAGLSTSSGKRKRSSSITPTARKSRFTTDSADAFSELLDQGKRRLKIANEILRRDQLARPTVYSIDECMRKLESPWDYT